MNKAAQSLGRLGGKAGTGKAKARTSEQARAAAQARWKRTKTKRQRMVREITEDESHMLEMMNSEYASKRPDRRTLRALWRLQEKGLAYKNYGVWRKTLLGERVRELLPS